MIAIPAGSFLMGSSGGDNNERPEHRVTLAAYCIDRTEVTVGAYAACVQAGRCPEPGTSSLCNGLRRDRWEHPANCVQWAAADAYCRWRGGRLPTEAEWEHAARGDDGRTYPWGDQTPNASHLHSSILCGRPECAGGTSPVGAHPAGAGPFGAQDMAGNVYEWVSDWYGPYPSAPTTDPTGPDEGRYRVIRGGGWLDIDARWVRSSLRRHAGPGNRDGDLGFRCARGRS